MPEEQFQQGQISNDKPQAGYTYYIERERLFRRRFWICLVLSIPVLLYSPILQQWLDSPTIQAWVDFSIPTFPSSRWVTPIFSLLIFFYGGTPLLRLAGHELRRYRPGMMTLVSLLILVALVYSLSTLVRDYGPTTLLIDATGAVFWELIVLINVLLLGCWLGLRYLRRALVVQEKLAQLMPATVERISAEGKTEEVAVDELQGGELILAHLRKLPSRTGPERPSARAEAAAEELATDPERGLSEDEVARRREKYGLNRLRKVKRRSVWQIFLDQFKSIVVILLAVAAALAFAFTQWAEGIAIMAVIVINGSIGFISEWRARQSMEALQKMGVQRVRVHRQGQDRTVAAEELVPGDIVLQESGDIVAADLRLIEANNLRVNEAALTGESVPVKKQAEPVEADRPLAERRDMLFKGTTVAEGSALGIVVATGMQTELGKISQLVAGAEKEATPLEERLDRLGQRLAWITIVIAAVVAGAGLWAGQPTLLMIETAIALGVAAIPEGLPIVATIALARGMWLMAQRQALINRLTAVETLGATHVICTDKTGTLTESRMTLRQVATPAGEYQLNGDTEPDDQNPLLRRVLEIGVLCNNASLDGEEGQGDPTEVALLRGGQQFGLTRDQLLDQKPEAREVPFDSEIMMMATYHQSEDGFEVAVKGAPGAVLKACDSIATEQGEARPMNEEDRQEWLKRTEDLASQGLRLLAMADKRVEGTDVEPYQALRFLGLVGLLDPPRKGVREAIDACQSAGIKVVMITGDQPATARAIARQVGLIEHEDRPVLQGRELDEPEKLSEEDRRRILDTEVFARINPEQKLHLVKIFQDYGYTVAMTGDGVNDTPALKKADIGIAMGQRGTDAARQVADMVLKDDAFSSIVAAVKQGRIIFGNIRKSVMFMLCTNVAEILAVALASLVKAPLPLLPLQILYLNILTDAWPALALGVGKGDPRVMQSPPRDPEEAVLTPSHWEAISGWSVLISACVLSALALALLWLDLEQTKAVTISFLTLGFAKLWFVLNLRDPGTRLLNNDIVLNPWIWISIAFCIALLVLAVYLPGLSDLLQTRPLAIPEWGLVLGLSVVPMLVGQGIRAFQRHSAEKISPNQQNNRIGNYSDRPLNL